MLRTITGKVTLTAILFLILIIALSVGSIQGSQSTKNVTNQLLATLNQATLHERFVQAFNRSIAESINAALAGDDDELAQAGMFLALAGSELDALNQFELRSSNMQTALLGERRAGIIYRLGLVLATITNAKADNDLDARGEVIEEIEEIEEELDLLVREQNQRLEQDGASNQAQINNLINFTQATVPFQFALVAASIAAAVWLLHRFIVRPIRILSQNATAIGEGKLEQLIQTNGIDEIGILQHALQQTAINIRAREQDIQANTRELQTALAEIKAREAEQAHLLMENTAQREVIRNAGIPVLPIGDHALLVPLIGSLDSARLQQLQQQTLHGLQQAHARFLILDITGVPLIDTQIARGLLDVVHSARLLGAEPILVGIRPEVAQSLVQLGLNLGNVKTMASLQKGISYALSADQLV